MQQFPDTQAEVQDQPVRAAVRSSPVISWICPSRWYSEVRWICSASTVLGIEPVCSGKDPQRLLWTMFPDGCGQGAQRLRQQGCVHSVIRTLTGSALSCQFLGAGRKAGRSGRS
ncbi:hypothetical protein GCM10015535_59580 [Streptomyces gelaticus]|uniref:Uncharacterized protein n=1 Tax=Streptomyces gelaticus TaxID=285446 RepID=A0ABQ2W9A2_9ACTN|nr:hypothetical protein GCM10015535_59580 [Streptomyces gelaticus]